MNPIRSVMTKNKRKVKRYKKLRTSSKISPREDGVCTQFFPWRSFLECFHLHCNLTSNRRPQCPILCTVIGTTGLIIVAHIFSASCIHEIDYMFDFPNCFFFSLFEDVLTYLPMYTPGVCIQALQKQHRELA